ncbi:MAG: class I SAM-dependent methyltransferase [Simkaniaceae bacterium]|nr:class I SAM-dependent methyltransferase [Simkaniaceae bacterium]
MVKHSEKNAWDSTTELLEDHKFLLGDHWSFNFRNDPKRLGFVLSRYKFAAKMLPKNGKILELGCSDGIGTTILAENQLHYSGVDLDGPSIVTAKTNLPGEKYNFIHDDFMDKSYGKFNGIVSLDVIEHIYKEHEHTYFNTIAKNLAEDGVCVIGTPNITADKYASAPSKLGHVNLYSTERLVNELEKYFHQVFPFGMNDEVMHTGFNSMAHYILCVACHKK